MNNRKAFALSWGRKLFFGIGWLITSLVALNYFQSMIIPQTFVGWIYFLATFIGHYGLILSLTFFLLYCPVVLIFPTYYVARIWSSFLLILINVFIYFDGLSFTSYRFHLNSFLWELGLQGGFKDILGFSPARLTIMSVVIFVGFIIIWIKGEKIWRTMQGRFSNPVKNWYFGFIAFCLLLSHGMHLYGDATGARYITRLANLFPVHYPLTGKTVLRPRGYVSNDKAITNQGYKDFYYPSVSLKCDPKESSNVVFIVIKKWSASDFNPELTPNLMHIASHGVVYERHFSGGDNSRDGLFSLIYSLPPTYLPSVLNAEVASVLINKLHSYSYIENFFSTNVQIQDTKSLVPNIGFVGLSALPEILKARVENEEIQPMFSFIYLNDQSSMREKDEQIKKIFEKLYRAGITENSFIVITGTHGNGPDIEKKFTLEDLHTPLIVIRPHGGERGVVNHTTSHYDIVPTVLQEILGCKNPPKHYSFGQSLSSPKPQPFHIAGTYKRLGIINFEKETVTLLKSKTGLNVRTMDGEDLGKETVDEKMVLSSLEKLTYFFKPR